MSKWVLVVDDDTSVLRLVSHILTQHDLRASCVRSGEAALAFVEQSEQLPDLVLLDILMPGMDGFETLAHLQKDPRGSELPVIFLTADEDSGSETKALEAGAMDFIKKPIIPEVLITRVRHTIDLTHLQRVLTSQVIEQTAAAVEHRERFDRLSLQLVHTLAGAIDAKDAYTNGHSERVATYAREIARRAGKSESVQENIYLIGLLHDVGKIGIPDTILNKPGKLTDEEYAVIKTHPLQGDKILRNISEFPELAIGARWHHERYDGYGYPDGIAGEQIPEEARIIAVADAYDAMTSSRSYRDPLSQERVRSEIVNGRWSQFDPVFADVMLQMIDEDVGYQMREARP
jgi:putative two-component system response regulator